MLLLRPTCRGHKRESTVFHRTEGVKCQYASQSKAILQACGDLGLCNKTEAVVVAASAGQNGNDLNCPLCEFLVSMLKEQLEDKDTEVELLAKAAEVSRSAANYVPSSPFCLALWKKGNQPLMASLLAT